MRLVGGTTPNEGRVEVKYDDVWSNVCYEKPESELQDGQVSDTRKWSFANADVVCRELGFPGTMFARQGGQGIGSRPSKVAGYKCKKGNRQTYNVHFSITSMNLISDICQLVKRFEKGFYDGNS